MELVATEFELEKDTVVKAGTKYIKYMNQEGVEYRPTDGLTITGEVEDTFEKVESVNKPYPDGEYVLINLAEDGYDVLYMSKQEGYVTVEALGKTCPFHSEGYIDFIKTQDVTILYDPHQMYHVFKDADNAMLMWGFFNVAKECVYVGNTDSINWLKTITPHINDGVVKEDVTVEYVSETMVVPEVSWTMTTTNDIIPDVGTDTIYMSKEDFVAIVNSVELHAEKLVPLSDMINGMNGCIDPLYDFTDVVVTYLEKVMQTDLVTYWMYEGFAEWIGDAGDLYDFILAHQGCVINYDYHIEQYHKMTGELNE